MKKRTSLLLALSLSLSLILGGCGNTASSASPSAAQSAGTADSAAAATASSGVDTTNFLQIAESNPDTVDPQCTSEYYAVGMNVFDRLVEIKANGDGTSEIIPSLAKSWEISDDGLTYTFALEDGVKYSNGADLTSSDVLYSFTRLLTYEKSVNDDIVDGIAGAEALADGTADTLSGFEIVDDHNFKITLTQPYAAFLACLTTPGASILDEETTEAAGDQFGIDPKATIGTGPFIFDSWEFNAQMVLVANPDCWSGAPASEGIVMKVIPDEDSQRMMFESGELDILDLDNAPSQADYFLNSDKYKDQIISGTRVGIYYIALNESFPPLDNLDVRKALQMSVDRQGILDAMYGGRGQLENGIFPHGLIGFNENLAPIEYDPEGAKALLAEAGYPNGFDLQLCMSSDSETTTKDLLEIVAAGWQAIGINATLEQIDDATYSDEKRAGKIMCYTSNWSADFNDPDNFIYTFYGNDDNVVIRSLCYTNEDAISRVAAARAIVDEDKRIAEYQDLEKTIIQDDAAWIPLFSKEHLFVVNPRASGFTVSWNGWSSNYYRNVSISA